MKPVKVVILNWNGRSHLERFLPVLVARTPGADIVVADNGSTDDSADFIRARFPQVELLLLDRNYGFAEGYNRALARIEADYCVLLNSDVEVTEGWLAPLVELLERDSAAAAVAPKIRSYANPGKFEYAGAAWYEKQNVFIPEEWRGKRIFIHLERAHWEVRACSRQAASPFPALSAL